MPRAKTANVLCAPNSPRMPRHTKNKHKAPSIFRRMQERASTIIELIDLSHDKIFKMLQN